MKWSDLKWQFYSEDCGSLKFHLGTSNTKARPWILPSYHGNDDNGHLCVCGHQKARCLLKTLECQCIESWGQSCTFFLFVISNILNVTPPTPPAPQQLHKTLKEPCWSCKVKWFIVCTSAALHMQISLYVYTWCNVLQLHNHVHICEKLLSHSVQEIQSLWWEMAAKTPPFFAEARRYVANDDENCRERMVTQSIWKLPTAAPQSFFADSSFM